MISRNIGWLFLVLVAGLVGCSSGDDTPAAPFEPTSPQEFTTRGWQSFESRHFDDGLNDFNAALDLLPTYGEALVGKAWCTLKLAANASGLDSAAAGFETARAAGETGSDVLAGLASARLGQGGSHLTEAGDLAQSVLTSDPSFVFTHQHSFNTRDLRLISAFAEAGAGDFNQALAQADLIEDSGITNTDPATWVVGSTSYNNFNAAVLARLHELSEEHAG